MQRRIAVGLAVLAVLALGYLGVSRGLGPGAKATPTPTVSGNETDKIISASGTLLPAKRANLAFKIPGQVKLVLANAGDAVRAGDFLLQLEAPDLEAAAAQAKAAADAAQANLTQARAGATREEIAIAEANLRVARAQLARLKAGATREEIAIAKANLNRAEAALQDAQADYDRISWMPGKGATPQSRALQLATLDYEIAKSRYEQVLGGATPEELRIAEANLAAAQAQLDRVKAGARPEEIAAAQGRADQAAAAYRQAQSALESATLLAPFAGTVASVSVNEGESVAPGVPVVALGDLSHLRVETDDLSETAVARVRVGQPVAVTFEALPGKTFKGKVTDIALIATQRQGGINYTVTIEVEGLDPLLRWGMTAHVEIDVR
ncbi:MAG: efflux RND transporter periplasmic adaptor subunit [Chloroflexota bacterium]